ncbi:MAG: hypothetical protein NT084_11685 [Bacteroidetes bacterium]|jgi:hypothetical protein|nr:hypothetical protein [Bacteroidota bacterium]
MNFKDKIKFNSIAYFVLSIVIRWLYNVVVWIYHGFSGNERVILHLLLAAASLVLGWFALQLFRRSSPSGSNLGCLYLACLILNLVGGVGALFYTLVQFFGEQGGAETLWLL